jgi:pimeloyl-ACP methyl ester carboxylesterase
MTESSQTEASSRLAAWGGVSRTADLGGPVHYVDFGGRADAPPVVLVHGLGGSHLNWCLLAPLLAEHARVMAVDLVGFGLTHPAGRSATVQANAALLDRFVRQVAGAPAVLVGNSMGGMVSILAAATRPDAVSVLALIDPALPWVAGVRPDRLVATTFMLYALPRVGERYLARRRATLTARELVQQVLDLCLVEPDVVPEELIAASVALVEHRATVPGLDAAFLTAARSLLQVSARRGRYWATMRTIRAPVLLMNGEQDRLVSVHSAREAAARNPHWRFHAFPGVGHVPQLEVPHAVADLILNWLTTTGVRLPAAG